MGILVLILGLGCNGERAPIISERQAPPVATTSLHPVIVGTPADSILAWRGKAWAVWRLGSDTAGLRVAWLFPDETYLLARRTLEGITAYRVTEVQHTSPGVHLTPPMP